MYKMKELLRLDQELFHTQDLGRMWGITNLNTLYTTIKRYTQKGILIPVRKGLYATTPPDRIDPVRLGLAVLHNYAYLGCETVLAREGVIFQAVQAITLVSVKSRKFEAGGSSYVVRQLNPSYLYQTIGIDDSKGYRQSSPERAVADMLYFNPHYHFDGTDRIDWKAVKLIQKQIGYL